MLRGYYYGDPLTWLATGHCRPSPHRSRPKPRSYPSPTPSLLLPDIPKHRTAPVHPASACFLLQPPAPLWSPGMTFPFPATPGEMHVSCCFPYLCWPRQLSDPRAARPWGRGCRDFLPETASAPGIRLPFLLLAGSPGRRRAFSRAGGCRPTPAATSGRSTTGGLPGSELFVLVCSV